MDMAGKEVVARIWKERDWHEQDGRIFLRQSKISQNWSWCENTWMMLENGKLQVKSYQEDDNICVDFIDTGVGVDAQLKDKIFDPFFTTKTAGKGLGLAIVKEIVGCYDGKITVEKVFAGGARFTVKLPIGG